MPRRSPLFGFLALGVLALTGVSCTKRSVWEYKVIQIMAQGGDSRTGPAAMRFAAVTPSEQQLNELGKEGWELTSSYLEMETAFPNFGNADYVTGIQPNVRPQRLVIIFKRPYQAPSADKAAGK